MKIYYDSEVDTAYIEMSKNLPDGVVEISEYLNIDTDKNGEIVGIELLNASKKIQIETLFNHEIDSELLETIYKKTNYTPVKEMVKDKKK